MYTFNSLRLVVDLGFQSHPAYVIKILISVNCFCQYFIIRYNKNSINNSSDTSV